MPGYCRNPSPCIPDRRYILDGRRGTGSSQRRNDHQLQLPDRTKTNSSSVKNGTVFQDASFLSGVSKKKYQIKDCWKNIPEQVYFYSSAFTEALLAHPDRAEVPPCHKKGLVIKAYAPRINKDYCLAICGNQKALGNWGPGQSYPYERRKLSGMADRTGCK